jgi:hypothetical protein
MIWSASTNGTRDATMTRRGGEHLAFCDSADLWNPLKLELTGF